ncbi:MAG: hypothetical protein LBL73_07090 [Synergistaceae bacterium]|jgi:hypothetical protein|nr:hypothetical protein [Synergistaceae bacterium]
MNTSATGGYIRESPGATRREQVEDAIHAMVVGLTGLDPVLVRPAFQEDPLAAPAPEVDWCAFHVADSSATNFPDARHVPDGDGHDEITDWTDKEIRLSFYGKLSEEYAGMTRRGLHIEQNRFRLRESGISVRRAGNAAPFPELVNGKWLRRCDLVIFATLEATGGYAVLNLLQSGGPVKTDSFRDGEQFATQFDTDGHARR